MISFHFYGVARIYNCSLHFNVWKKANVLTKKRIPILEQWMTFAQSLSSPFFENLSNASFSFKLLTSLKSLNSFKPAFVCSFKSLMIFKLKLPILETSSIIHSLYSVNQNIILIKLQNLPFS